MNKFIFVLALLGIVVLGSCSSRNKENGKVAQTDAISENGADSVSEGKPVMLDFMADWCPPCRKMQPIVEHLGKKYENRILIRKINVDENPAMASHYNIEAIPTFIFIDSAGNVKSRLVGYQTEQDMEKHLNEILE